MLALEVVPGNDLFKVGKVAAQVDDAARVTTTVHRTTNKTQKIAHSSRIATKIDTGEDIIDMVQNADGVWVMANKTKRTPPAQKLLPGPDPKTLRLEAPQLKPSKEAPYEPFLPDEYYKKCLPERISPGINYRHKYNVDGEIVQTKFYDAHGREKGWVDYITHNQPGYTSPHSHQRTYNQHTPEQGYKIDYRMTPSFPKWLGD